MKISLLVWVETHPACSNILNSSLSKLRYFVKAGKIQISVICAQPQKNERGKKNTEANVCE